MGQDKSVNLAVREILKFGGTIIEVDFNHKHPQITFRTNGHKVKLICPSTSISSSGFKNMKSTIRRLFKTGKAR